MNLKIILLLLGYLGWSGGSTYWYVCKIKNLCPDEPAASNLTVVEPIAKSDSVPVNASYQTEINETFDASFNIQFKSGSSEYLPNTELEEFLVRMADYLKKHPGKKLTIIGHTDGDGDEKKNFTLGLGRAESVKESIIGHGANDETITADSKGETSPVSDNSTKEGKESNRRVEFKIN